MKKWLLAIPIILLSSQVYGATITWSKDFEDGQVLSGSDFDNLQTNITDVVNAGGGPVTLTANQTLSGDNTYSGASTFSGAITASSTVTANGNVTIGNAVTDNLTITSAIQGASPLILDGATDNTNEMTIAVPDFAADRTTTFPDFDLDFREQVVKGWVQYDQGTGTAALQDNYNVSSITDGSTGVATINWATDFTNSNYAVVCGSNNMGFKITGLGTGTTEITTVDDTGSVVDANNVCCISIGDQV